jgi:hypothetical protein
LRATAATVAVVVAVAVAVVVVVDLAIVDATWDSPTDRAPDPVRRTNSPAGSPFKHF